jgi:restriction system protein
MPPRNLLLSIALGGLATLAHPFAFAAKAAAAAGSSVGRTVRRFIGWRESAARSKLDTAQWTPELLKRLEWRRFEELCAAYFEALGFRAELAGVGADGGVAINLYEQGSKSASIIVQCRPWTAHRVGIRPVRELRGAMASGNVGEGMLVTSGKFTREARDFAGKEGVSLIDGADLVAKLAALVPEKALALYKLATRGDFQTPTCPSCAIKMISRKSTAHGRRYWGCRNYPACKQILFEQT